MASLLMCLYGSVDEVISEMLLGGPCVLENPSKTHNVGGPLGAPFWIILVFFLGSFFLARGGGLASLAPGGDLAQHFMCFFANWPLRTLFS